MALLLKKFPLLLLLVVPHGILSIGASGSGGFPRFQITAKPGTISQNCGLFSCFARKPSFKAEKNEIILQVDGVAAATEQEERQPPPALCKLELDDDQWKCNKVQTQDENDRVIMQVVLGGKTNGSLLKRKRPLTRFEARLEGPKYEANGDGEFISAKILIGEDITGKNINSHTVQVEGDGNAAARIKYDRVTSVRYPNAAKDAFVVLRYKVDKDVEFRPFEIPISRYPLVDGPTIYQMKFNDGLEVSDAARGVSSLRQLCAHGCLAVTLKVDNGSGRLMAVPKALRSRNWTSTFRIPQNTVAVLVSPSDLTASKGIGAAKWQLKMHNVKVTMSMQNTLVLAPTQQQAEIENEEDPNEFGRKIMESNIKTVVFDMAKLMEASVSGTSSSGDDDELSEVSLTSTENRSQLGGTHQELRRLSEEGKKKVDVLARAGISIWVVDDGNYGPSSSWKILPGIHTDFTTSSVPYMRAHGPAEYGGATHFSSAVAVSGVDLHTKNLLHYLGGNGVETHEALARILALQKNGDARSTLVIADRGSALSAAGRERGFWVLK